MITVLTATGGIQSQIESYYLRVLGDDPVSRSVILIEKNLRTRIPLIAIHP